MYLLLLFLLFLFFVVPQVADQNQKPLQNHTIHLQNDQRRLRTIAKEIDQRHAAELEERDRDLAAKVLQATFEQVECKIQSDIEILKKLVPTADKEARESGLDVKYVKDRQRILVEPILGQDKTFSKLFGLLVSLCVLLVCVCVVDALMDFLCLCLFVGWLVG